MKKNETSFVGEQERCSEAMPLREQALMGVSHALRVLSESSPSDNRFLFYLIILPLVF